MKGTRLILKTAGLSGCLLLALSWPALGVTITVSSWIAAQLQPGESANFLTSGPDGNVWATEQAKGQIVRIKPADSSVTRYALPANTIPLQITAGPDGNLWFSSLQLQGGSPVSIIGRATTTGTVSLFNYPDPSAFTLFMSGPIAGSSDGNVYVVNTTSYKTGIINAAASAKIETTSLVLTEAASPFGIGLLLIAPRSAGGIFYCGQSKPSCGTLIAGLFRPFPSISTMDHPASVSQCSVGTSKDTLCALLQSFQFGPDGDHVWAFTDLGWQDAALPPVGTSSFLDLPDRSLWCLTSLDGSEACISNSPQALRMIDLSSGIHGNTAVIGGPEGVNLTSVRLYQQSAGLDVLVIGEKPGTRDANVWIGAASVTATPPARHRPSGKPH